MLVEKKFNTNDVVSIKLVTGEEIIARFKEVVDGNYKVNKPRAIASGGQGSFGLIPAMFSADLDKDAVEIDASKIVIIAQTHKEIADQYIAMTSTIKPVSSLTGLNLG